MRLFASRKAKRILELLKGLNPKSLGICSVLTLKKRDGIISYLEYEELMGWVIRNNPRKYEYNERYWFKPCDWTSRINYLKKLAKVK
jgi:hypothetical protein